MSLVDLPNQQVTWGNPRDLAQELGVDGITTLLRIICEAYEKLRAHGKVTPTMEEPKITEELCIELELIWKMTDISLIPIHEKSHSRKEKRRGRTPTIDFCFRHKWYRDSYFGAECKLLEEKNNRLYDQYIEQGVYRYLSGKYSENCSHGSMIGYIRIGSAMEVINEVRMRVKKLPDSPSMQQADPIGWFTEHYKSIHNRDTGFSPFHMHHLFFSFT